MKAISKLIDSGLTRKQIALTIGVSEQAVGMVDRGNRWPSRSTFARLARISGERGAVLLAKKFSTTPPEGEASLPAPFISPQFQPTTRDHTMQRELSLMGAVKNP